MSAHLVRTTHHDTGVVELFCGETRVGVEDPNPADPVCTRCLLAAVESEKHRTVEDIRNLAEAAENSDRENMRKVIAWVDDITLRLERLERKARKGGKR